MTNDIIKLAKFFGQLPSVGPRQAKRFAYALLNKNQKFLEEFSGLIINLKKNIKKCESCARFFPKNGKEECEICGNLARDNGTILILEKDTDIENVENAGFYKGKYFVLGGLLPIMGPGEPEIKKIKNLFEVTRKKSVAGNLKEIILAFSATPEGDNTARYIEKILEPILSQKKIKISRLGRGLSTGTELEYSDSETIINALKNRQ